MFSQITPAVKNIIILNVLVFLAAAVIPGLQETFTGYYFQSPNFRPWQIITHMFTHAPLRSGNIGHIFFNMYALFLFGSALERYWGAKKFLVYYLISGLGAFFLHEAINYYTIHNLMSQLSASEIQDVFENGYSYLTQNRNYTNQIQGSLNLALNIGVVGASGCVFGVLLAFGMLFPNTQLMLLFPPIPLKAKFFVMIYGALELYLALQNAPDDNVAHFAHLGGMIFGFILLKYWQKRDGTYYKDRI
ncbi:MAG: rhomboid family intramembrane serine protease [Flavobacteriales bacterium]